MQVPIGPFYSPTEKKKKKLSLSVISVFDQDFKAIKGRKLKHCSLPHVMLKLFAYLGSVSSEKFRHKLRHGMLTLDNFKCSSMPPISHKPRNFQ